MKLGSKTKLNLDFLKIFNNTLSKYITNKQVFKCIGYIFGNIPLSNRGLVIFYLNFQNFLYVMLYQLTKFQYLTFFTFEDIKQLPF